MKTIRVALFSFFRNQDLSLLIKISSPPKKITSGTFKYSILVKALSYLNAPYTKYNT